MSSPPTRGWCKPKKRTETRAARLPWGRPYPTHHCGSITRAYGIITACCHEPSTQHTRSEHNRSATDMHLQLLRKNSRALNNAQRIIRSPFPSSTQSFMSESTSSGRSPASRAMAAALSAAQSSLPNMLQMKSVLFFLARGGKNNQQ